MNFKSGQELSEWSLQTTVEKILRVSELPTAAADTGKSKSYVASSSFDSLKVFSTAA